MNATELALDAALVLVLALLAWRALAVRDLFEGAVLFICFGLVMALAWARLAAPDLALAEAVIGAGLTGVLLVQAVRIMSVAPDTEKQTRDERDSL